MTAFKRSPGSQRWRADVAQHLARAGLLGEAYAFDTCGDDDNYRALAVCSETPEHFAIPILRTCHLRICPECEGRAQKKRLDHLLPAIEDAHALAPSGYSLKLVTLTTPYSLLDPDIRPRLQECIAQARDTLFAVTYDKLEKRLSDAERRRKLISLNAHGVGFVMGLEFGENGLKLHFHALYSGPYLEQEKLAAKWSEMTGGACQVVDVRRVDDAREGAEEVIAKYATKLTALPPGMAPRLHYLLKGTRRVRTYGIFYNIAAEDDEPQACPHCGAPLTYMHRLAYELLGSKKLHLKPGNKFGETELSQPPQRPPIPVPKPVPLPGIDPEAPAAAKWDTWLNE